ncbi:MAG: hypothetical protein AB1750_11200, partial [Chloroflexota bacterium]
GIGFLLLTLVGLGLYGWDGALTLGAPIAGAVAVALAALVYWLTPRIPWLNPVRTRPSRAEAGASAFDAFYSAAWNAYRQTGRLIESFLAALEGDGGILWALLFLVLFISILAPRLP